MYEIFSNPSTLLCLGITFLLISLLFFYFKRNISALEKTQLEQVRMLHQFIANTEMQMNSNNKMHTSSNNYPAPPVNSNNENYTNEPNSELIDVSDGEEESDSDESDSYDSESDNDAVELDANNSIKEIEIVDIGAPIEHLDEETGVTDIKVIQLQDDDSKGKLEIENLENSDDSDEDSDDDSDDVVDSDGEVDIAINKGFSNNLENVMDVTDSKEKVIVKETLKTNYKSLNVTSLRQIAEENGLIEKGEKKNKKDLLELLG